jgi:hypothetical protein
MNIAFLKDVWFCRGTVPWRLFGEYASRAHRLEAEIDAANGVEVLATIRTSATRTCAARWRKPCLDRSGSYRRMPVMTAYWTARKLERSSLA